MTDQKINGQYLEKGYEKSGLFPLFIQKLVIKDVVIYADKKIAATK